MTTTTFTGTPGASASTELAAAGLSVYGAAMVYNAAGDGVITSGDYSYSQITRAAVNISAPTLISAIINKTANDADDECGLCFVNDARTGVASILMGTTLTLRKEIAGSGGAVIATGSITQTLGQSSPSLFLDPATGEVVAYYGGVEIASGVYDGSLVNLHPGYQNYKAGTVERFSLVSFNDNASTAVTISSIDQLIEGATSTVTFSEPFTPTGLLIFDGDSGIIESSFSGSGTTWTFTCPPLTDGVPGPRLGAVVVTATDGVDTTAEFASTYAKTGYTGVVLTSVATGHVGQGFSPALEIGNQIAYDNTKGVVGADGIYVDEPPDAYTGVQTMWDHNATDFTWRSFIVETIDGEVVIDHTPDPFSFTAVNDADPSTEYTSNEVTISGLGLESDLTIVGGEYSKNGGAFTSAAGVISNDDTLELKVTSAANPMDSVNSTVTVGTFSATFTVNGPDVVASFGGDEFGTIYLTARGM